MSLLRYSSAALQQAAFFLQRTTPLNRPLPAGQPTALLGRAFSSIAKPGLFGIPKLNEPADYVKWAIEAEEKCEGLIQKVLQAPNGPEVVQLLDDMSNEMCQVYDSAECCRNVHSNEAWRRAASEACQHMGAFVAEVNQHQGIYQKLKATLEQWEAAARHQSSPATSNTGSSHHYGVTTTAGAASGGSSKLQALPDSQYQRFTSEAVIVGHKLLLDFEKSGIHLKDIKQRGELQELMARNGHYGALFNHALADAKQLGITQIPAELLPSDWASQINGWRPGAISKGLFGRKQQLTLPLDSPTMLHFLASMPNEDARKMAYVAGHRTPEHNLKLLDEMLTCRADLAHLLGFPSYAHFKCYQNTLAEVPEAAMGFLEGLSAQLKPLADLEVEQLRKMKADDLGNPGASLFAWDQNYYIARAKARLRNLQSAKEAAAPYLHLSSVLKGLSELLTRLMGLRLVPERLEPQEVWGPGVTKLRVESLTEGLMGTLYIDIGRHGKTAGSVLYPVICGRDLPGGGYQCPVLVLVTSCSGGTALSEEPVLTWRELRTLMHEMGHAVHNFVSRTHFQHLWGTRCAQDVVEVPSHLWEHFVTDPRSLALLARHAHTREPMPPQLMEQLEAAQQVFPALELQQQVLLSLLDLTLHGHPPTKSGHTNEVLAHLASKHSSIPYVKGTSPQARFNHLTIYGASYYTYLYARCLSSSIWEADLQQDPLSPAAGDIIRSKLLAPGGTIEPLELLKGTLGQGSWEPQLRHWPGGGWSPCYDALLHKVGQVHMQQSAALGA